MNWNFQEILTKDPSSAWGCDTSGNILSCGVALRRTCRCTEFHRVKNANLPHPSAMWEGWKDGHPYKMYSYRKWKGNMRRQHMRWQNQYKHFYMYLLKCKIWKIDTLFTSLTVTFWKILKLWWLRPQILWIFFFRNLFRYRFSLTYILWL